MKCLALQHCDLPVESDRQHMHGPQAGFVLSTGRVQNRDKQLLHIARLEVPLAMSLSHVETCRLSCWPGS